MTSKPLHLSLGPLDHMLPRHYARFVIYLSLKPGISYEAVFAELQRGLQKTFCQLPWLNGKVFWQSRKSAGWRPGQLEIRYAPVESDGAAPWQFKYKELDTDISFDELKETGFPTDAFDDEELLWAPFAPDLDKGADVFIAQANFIRGACILCASIFHSVADGMADVSIFKQWADHCQGLPTGETNNTDLPSGCADRGLLENLWEKYRSAKPVAEMENAKTWSIVGLDAPGRGHTTEEQGSADEAEKISDKSKRYQQSAKKMRDKTMLRSRIFYVSPDNFVALKRECAQENRLVSGNDAISALIWRGLIKARTQANRDEKTVEADNGESRLEMTVDGRPYLSLPPSYLGNVVLLCRARLPCSTLASNDTSLTTVAQYLRESTSGINPETALDAYSLARGLKSYRRFDERSTPIAGARMLITSLLAMPASSMGFGDNGVFDNGGKAEAIRPLMGALNRYFRICWVLPPTAYGGVEIVFNLSDAELECLLQDREFGKYAM
ncbi:hypothetical protein BDW02DRAFT_523382, partial [Decorospora gaudefroyi]